MDSIYLDNSATTQIDPRVVDSMRDCYLQIHGNPASQHQLGQAARYRLEAAREQIAELLNVRVTDPNGDRIIFTSGGTESNNLALFGSIEQPSQKSILVSSIEHPSLLEPIRSLETTACSVHFINALPSGLIDLDHLTELANQPVQFVAVMAGNNETGVLQPIDRVAQILESHNCHFHVDAVQSIGKLTFDFQQSAASSVSFAAHKFHGPVGIGGLILRKGVRIKPVQFGGSQQLGTRPGTESVALAVGMAKALEICQSESEQRRTQMLSLRDQLEQQILASCPEVRVNGQSERLPHVVNLSFPGIDRQPLLMALDFAGIACSTGSACESGSSEPSHVLQAMGLGQARISSSIRFSLSALTTKREIDLAVRRILKVLNDLGFPKSERFSDS